MIKTSSIRRACRWKCRRKNGGLKYLKRRPRSKEGCGLINAGASIYIGNKAESIEEGIKIATEIIDSGAAFKRMNQLISLSQEENIVFKEYLTV